MKKCFSFFALLIADPQLGCVTVLSTIKDSAIVLYLTPVSEVGSFMGWWELSKPLAHCAMGGLFWKKFYYNKIADTLALPIIIRGAHFFIQKISKSNQGIPNSVQL